MRKSSRLPKQLQSVKKKCPKCQKKQFMQNKFEQNEWKCQKCGFVNIKFPISKVVFKSGNGNEIHWHHNDKFDTTKP